MVKAIAVMVIFVTATVTGRCAEPGLPIFQVPDCLGVNIHFASGQEKQVQQLAAAGFKFIRMDVIWSNVEKEKGRYDFTGYDGLLSDLEKHGVRALFILCYGNSLYDDGKAPHTDEGRAAFVKFVSAAARHFSGHGILWELWNEPNLSKFWRPEASAEDYIALAELVYPAIKKADPSGTVLAPALAGWDFAYFENLLKLGLLDYTDVVSLHAYGSAIPEDAARYYSTIRSLIEKYDSESQTPIVSGEWGYPAVGDTTVEKQAQYLVRSFLVNLMNDVRLSIWYDWHDDGPDPNEGEHHFGTVYLDFKEKPAYFAVQTLNRELDGCSFAVRLPGDSENDYLALFRKGNEYRLAAWTTGKPHNIKIPLDVAAVDFVSLEGKRTRAEVKDGMLEIGLSEAPQYVEPVGRSIRWAAEAGWTVSASTFMQDGVLGVKVDSEMYGEATRATQIDAEGEGFEPCTVNLGGLPEPGFTGPQCIARYTWNGKENARVKVTLHVAGLERPLVRIVELNTSACPTIDVLPPTQRELLIAINRPAAGPAEDYSGTLSVGNSDGIRLLEQSRKFTIPKGQDRTIARFKMAQAPAAVYSFATKLVDEHGNQVLRAPARRYSLLETFADGDISRPISKYLVELDGDSSVLADAKLIYVDAPLGGPVSRCAKLEYKFDDGWRFLRVSPRPMIGIHDSPRSVKIWIKGDNKDGLARLRFADSGDQTFQPDYGRINFTEWRCMEADLTGSGAGHWGGENDGQVRYPIKWDTLFLIDNAGGRKTKGAVYLGPMMVCYD